MPDLLDRFSAEDRGVVLELLRRIVQDPDNNLNVVTFLVSGDGTHLNTEAPRGGAGADGLMGSGAILQLMVPLMDRATMTHSSFSFNHDALQYMRDRLNPPDASIRAAIGERVYQAYLAENQRDLYFSTIELAEEIGVEQYRVGTQLRALQGVGLIKLDRDYYPDINFVAAELTPKGRQWAFEGFPEFMGNSTVQVSVDVHVDVVATIRSVREDPSIDPELRQQWEAAMKRLEASIEEISDKSPMKAAVDVLETSTKAAGLFLKTVEFLHRHVDDIVRLGGSTANMLH